MMLLAIDVGNTNTVFAVYVGEVLQCSWRLPSVPRRTADEYAVFLYDLFKMHHIDWSDVSDVIVSSVVPESDLHIVRFAEKYLQVTPRFVTKDLVDMEISFDRPEEVGADRLVNALAVKTFYRSPAIVIDFGTATTFDVIDGDQCYAGGIIAPGIHLSIEALGAAAAKLPRVAIEKPSSVMGRSTVGAIQSGVFWGYISMIEGLVARLGQEMGAEPFVLATGGLASLFADSTDVIEAVDEELTLKGLLEIYKGMEH